mmetsp:Transcript_83715/g.223917  ORF Transcript_83715/g.223917 Transcript_83715/m.223917 type:complete len:211 (+) Transcript_83715:2120-2752(+)
MVVAQSTSKSGELIARPLYQWIPGFVIQQRFRGPVIPPWRFELGMVHPSRLGVDPAPCGLLFQLAVRHDEIDDAADTFTVRAQDQVEGTGLLHSSRISIQHYTCMTIRLLQTFPDNCLHDACINKLATFDRILRDPRIVPLASRDLPQHSPDTNKRQSDQLRHLRREHRTTRSWSTQQDDNFAVLPTDPLVDRRRMVRIHARARQALRPN